MWPEFVFSSGPAVPSLVACIKDGIGPARGLPNRVKPDWFVAV